ncbi:MAG: S41 family peptidase [Balneolaceae bacterium]
MKKYSIIPIILLLPLSIFGQKELSNAQVLEDYTIFKEILINGHPSLYEYTSQTEWDSIFSSFEQKGIKKVKTSNDLFKSISSVADNVKDGHLNILHPKIDTLPAMFPVMVKFIGGKLYTDTDDFGIPLGSKIMSIDSMPSQTILKDFLKYAPSDGYNLTKKYCQIEKEFGILHYYEYGNSESYSVKYMVSDGETKTIEVAPKSFESIGNIYPNRNSHFAEYHQKTNRMEYFKNRIAEKWPFVYYIDSINTAVLTVNSFGLDPQEFKSKLISLFKEIKKKKAENLIIDIRQNIGGYRINAINLYSFLTNEPFKQRISESAISKVLPHEENVIHTMSDYSEFFEMYFSSAKKENGRWILTEDHAKAEMIPYKKTFKGKVYVLVGGNTFSAASAFALSAKNSKEIILVGEETGGGYYFHTAQYSALYELPNSKIMVRMPFVKIDKYVLDYSVPKGSGILPDIEIPLKIKDLIDGKDNQLDYVVKQINKE